MKAKHQKPGGLLQEIQVPTWKWEDINMDFLVGLPRTQRQYDSIWVVVDRLTKSANFIPVKSCDSMEDYSRIFIDDIVYRHGILLYFISDRGKNIDRGFGGHSMKSWRSFHPQWIVKRRVLFKPLRTC